MADEYFLNPVDITEEHIKSQLDPFLPNLYEHLTAKGMDLRTLGLHRRDHGKWDSDQSLRGKWIFLEYHYTISFLDLAKNLKDKIWVEIVSGKYKGSIGHIGSVNYNGLQIQINSNGDETGKLSAKALRYLPDYTGGFNKAVKARVIKDIFDQIIEPDSKVIFAERGKLRIGVLLEYDYHRNIAIIRTADGTEDINPRTSQIVNCQKINESFIKNTVLTAILTKD